jgi:DHA1 family bicyclomycin/chloramphenicol resistance-like MFS transporter
MNKRNASLGLAVAAAAVELDIILPCLPMIQEGFSVDSDVIGLAISANFFSFCIASLIVGPLSDFLGRKKIFIGGLGFLTVGTLGCLAAKTFLGFIFYRVLQGIGSSAPITIGFRLAAELDRKSKSSKTTSYVHTIVTAATIAGPPVGALIAIQFGWRAIFIFIGILVFVSLGLVTRSFPAENSEDVNKRSLPPLALKAAYKSVLMNRNFWTHGLSAIFLYAAIMLYLTYAPLNSFNFGKTEALSQSVLNAGISQSVIMLAFCLGSICMFKFVNFENEAFFVRTSFYVLWACGLFLLISSLTDMKAATLSTAVMTIFGLASSIVINSSSAKAMANCENFSGIASSVLGASRLGLTSLCIFSVGVYGQNTVQIFYRLIALLVFFSWILTQNITLDNAALNVAGEK